ncbi:MAG: hypothetical protein QXJ64_06820 [Thermosphaera sp.]
MSCASGRAVKDRLCCALGLVASVLRQPVRDVIVEAIGKVGFSTPKL